MEAGSSGQGARLPAEAPRRRMATVSTQMERERDSAGKKVGSRGEEGEKTGGKGRSERCQSSGILQEEEKDG